MSLFVLLPFDRWTSVGSLPFLRREVGVLAMHMLIIVVRQAVAPGVAFGRAVPSRSRPMGRAAALVMVCGLAACVALLGGIGDAEEPVSQAFLAVKAEIESKPASHLSGMVL